MFCSPPQKEVQESLTLCPPSIASPGLPAASQIPNKEEVFKQLKKILDDHEERLTQLNCAAGARYITVFWNCDVTLWKLCKGKADFIKQYSLINHVEMDSAKRQMNRVFAAIAQFVLNDLIPRAKNAYDENKRQINEWLQRDNDYWDADTKMQVSTRMTKYTFFKAVFTDSNNGYWSGNGYLPAWCYNRDEIDDDEKSYKLHDAFPSLDSFIKQVMDSAPKSSQQLALNQWGASTYGADDDFSWPPPTADRQQKQQGRTTEDASHHAKSSVPVPAPAPAQQRGAASADFSDADEEEDEEEDKEESPSLNGFIDNDGGYRDDNDEGAEADEEFSDADAADAAADGKKKKKPKPKKTAAGAQKGVKRRFEYDGKVVQLAKISFKWFKSLINNQQVLGEVIQAVFEDLIAKSEADMKLEKRFYIALPLNKWAQMTESRISKNAESGKCEIVDLADEEAAIGKQG